MALAREHSLGLPMSAFVNQYLHALPSYGIGTTEITVRAGFSRRGLPLQ